MTQMTQMTQGPPAGWRGHAGASLQHARAGHGRRPVRRWPLAIPTMLVGVPVGPSGKGPRERTDREQFFSLLKFFLL